MVQTSSCTHILFFLCSYDRTVRSGHRAGVDVTGVAHVGGRELENPHHGGRGIVGGFVDRNRCHHRVHTGRQGSGHIRPEAHHRRASRTVHHQLGDDLLRLDRLGTVCRPSDSRRGHRRSHCHRSYVHRRDSRKLH